METIHIHLNTVARDGLAILSCFPAFGGLGRYSGFKAGVAPFAVDAEGCIALLSPAQNPTVTPASGDPVALSVTHEPGKAVVCCNGSPMAEITAAGVTVVPVAAADFPFNRDADGCVIIF